MIKKQRKPKACCPFCGCTNLWVHEESSAKAYTDPENPNTLKVRTEGGEISLIECMNEECPKAEHGNLANITSEFLGLDVQIEFD